MGSSFSAGILVNGVGDVVLATGVANSLLEAGPFKNYASRSVLVSAFAFSYFIHGVIRVVGSQGLTNRSLRQLTVFSYLAESIGAVQLIANGAMEGPIAMVFAIAPWLAIVYLVFFYVDEEDDHNANEILKEEL